MSTKNMDFFTESSTVKNAVTCAKNRSILSLFDVPNRVNDFSLSAAGLYLDYSKQNITKAELRHLVMWAQEYKLSHLIKAMFTGDKINNTEQRAVLHTVLRAPSSVKHQVLGKEAVEVEKTELHMAQIVSDVSEGTLTGITGEKFTDVLAIGIGGSYYGIKVGLSALHPYHSTGLKVHVLANVDGAAVTEKLETLQAATTLVVIISKTFTTQETLLNAKAIKTWMLAELNDNNAIAKQWYAVSSNVEKAQRFGLNAANILPMWD